MAVWSLRDLNARAESGGAPCPVAKSGPMRGGKDGSNNFKKFYQNWSRILQSCFSVDGFRGQRNLTVLRSAISSGEPRLDSAYTPSI